MGQEGPAGIAIVQGCQIHWADLQPEQQVGKPARL